MTLRLQLSCNRSGFVNPKRAFELVEYYSKAVEIAVAIAIKHAAITSDAKAIIDSHLHSSIVDLTAKVGSKTARCRELYQRRAFQFN